MDIATTTTVIQRNDLGQFIKECEVAAGRTIARLIDDGMKMSRRLAPVGVKADSRTPTLKAAMFKQQLSRTSGVWGNFARHALPVEFGAGPHVIRGNPALGFFWEAKGRMWVPAAAFYGVPGMVDLVNHPGNPSQPYLRPAYDAIMARAVHVASSEYPG